MAKLVEVIGFGADEVGAGAGSGVAQALSAQALSLLPQAPKLPALDVAGLGVGLLTDVRGGLMLLVFDNWKTDASIGGGFMSLVGTVDLAVTAAMGGDSGEGAGMSNRSFIADVCFAGGGDGPESKSPQSSFRLACCCDGAFLLTTAADPTHSFGKADIVGEEILVGRGAVFVA